MLIKTLVLLQHPKSPVVDEPAPGAFLALPPWKRGLDLAFCLLVLPVLAVCTLFMAVVIKFSSPGPIMFTQERVGLRGRRFMIFKFRTMHVSADVSTHHAHLVELIRSNVPMEKMDGRRDPRLIRGGWLLRASGLDELPQIINVLRGEMSLVGPRPCLPYEYSEYSPHQRDRFRSAPGLTGLWQVSGKNRTTFDDMIRLDTEYADRKSLWLDLTIMLRTLPALISQIIDTRRTRRATATPFASRPSPGADLLSAETTPPAN